MWIYKCKYFQNIYCMCVYLYIHILNIHSTHTYVNENKTYNCTIVTRAVRLIEIEIKSRFEIARFLNRFIARFFSAPCPNLPQYAIRTNQNAAEQNRPGIQTDSMLKKQGRWVQNRIRTWWPKKCMLHAEHTAGSSDHVSFRAESVFLKIPLRLLNTLSATR